ncbi:hypothetical protein JQC91_10515 [Jannaschia sp. Os4]|uniref:hypothetical protein n=1 Tax=Jannaschia sp. Os4 TaxID=2807617 RepID=UPI00193A6189|nr:hypothetical protein [Jannaschia sp. Os4]MBM2576737.1 hypothetical protein [Jannaschia sp. Os4]
MARLLLCLLLLPASAAAQAAFVGLYAPPGLDWACTEDGLGVEGGAIGVVNRQLFEPGRVCDLTEPVTGDDGTIYRALCAAEGRQWVEEVVIRRLPAGLEVERGETVDRWARCAPPGYAANGEWRARTDGGVTSDAYGNAVEVGCDRIALRLDGTAAVEGTAFLSVDDVTFAAEVGPGGVIARDCLGCASAVSRIAEAVATGDRLRVEDAGGRSATFHLRGSRAAIGRCE